MMQTIILVSVAFLALTVIGLSAAQILLARRVRREAQQNAAHVLSIRRLQEDLAALCKASRGAGEHLVKAEQQIHRVMERMSRVELRGGTDQSYSRAIQLVQQGSNVNELVDVCGLTRGEAELIVMLHGAGVRAN